MNDKFEYTPTGILEAIAWLRSTGDIQNITECNGSVDNSNAVAYANVRWGMLHKQFAIELTYEQIHGIEKDDEQTDN